MIGKKKTVTEKVLMVLIESGILYVSDLNNSPYAVLVPWHESFLGSSVDRVQGWSKKLHEIFQVALYVAHISSCLKEMTEFKIGILHGALTANLNPEWIW